MQGVRGSNGAVAGQPDPQLNLDFAFGQINDLKGPGD